MPCATCGQLPVAEEPHHRPAIEGADLLQDDARGECRCARRKFCDQSGCCSLFKGASRCDEFGNAPFPLALNDDKAVAEQLGINFNGRARACDEKRYVAHCAFKFAPGVTFAHEDALATIDKWTVILIVKRFSRINAPLYGEVAVFTNEQRLFWCDWGKARHQSRGASACAAATTRPDRECDQPDTKCEQQRAHPSARPVAGSIDCVAPAILVRINCPPSSSAAPTTSVWARRHFTSPSARIAHVSTSL